MRYKVLTVDDSKTVRIIVKKAFKPFDCEIFEAANGVEGLAVASKETPDLILLDVTMPLLRAHEPKARLRNLEHRGKVSAAMMYDQLPIIDVFRRIDDTTLLGLMDVRAAAQPYFFVLTCD